MEKRFSTVCWKWGSQTLTMPSVSLVGTPTGTTVRGASPCSFEWHHGLCQGLWNANDFPVSSNSGRFLLMQHDATRNTKPISRAGKICFYSVLKQTWLSHNHPRMTLVSARSTAEGRAYFACQRGTSILSCFLQDLRSEGTQKDRLYDFRGSEYVAQYIYVYIYSIYIYIHMLYTCLHHVWWYSKPIFMGIYGNVMEIGHFFRSWVEAIGSRSDLGILPMLPMRS